MSEIHPQAGSHHSLDNEAVDEQTAATAQAAPTSVEPVAPQNTQVAGAANAEQYKQLHSNVSGSEQKGNAEKAKDLADEMPGGSAGYHSSGSYTGTSGGSSGGQK